MPAPQQVLSLTNDIYDAALDPTLWPDVLRRISHFVGGPASVLVSQDLVSRAGRFYFSWGDEPCDADLYFQKCAKLNPARASIMVRKAGEVRSLLELVPVEEFHRSRLYLEWAKPAGYGDATIAVIENSPAVITLLTTHHRDDDGRPGEEAHRRMELVVPHVRRAVAIAKMIELHKVEARVLAEAVDALAAAVFLVNEHAQIVRANVSGRAMLAAGGILRQVGGVLAAAEPRARQELAEAIAAATEQGLVGRCGIALPLASRDGERHVAHVLPLTAGARRQAASSYAAVAAVFVHRAALDGPLPLEAIAQHFNLSPAELRVLVAVIEVGGVPEVAPVLGISEATVKTHLRRLFEKTGTKRQADLVKLLAGYSTPLLSRSEQSAQ